MGEFAHRRTRVYSAALDMAELAYELTRSAPRACWPLVDQTLRATTSVCLNLAEGVGEYAAGDKERFFRIARRSAAEAGAGFDLLARFGVLTTSAARDANHRLQIVAAMLTGLIHAAHCRPTALRADHARQRHYPAPLPEHQHEKPARARSQK